MLRPDRDRPPSVAKRAAHHPSHKRAVAPAQQGDAQWLRVMHTKEAQWRFMNTIALHEMNLLERRACEQLENLSSRLDAITAATAQKRALVAACRAYRAKQMFRALAAPVLHGLAAALSDLRPGYVAACQLLLDAARCLRLRALTLSSQTALERELAHFRDVASRFQHAARDVGLPDLVLVCDALDQLAGLVVAEEAHAVSCAAEAVAEAARASEFERSVLAEKVTRIRAKKSLRKQQQLLVRPN